MDATAEGIAREAKAGLERLYGARLVGLYVFGFHARGEAGPESDVDLLIVLDRVDHYAGEIDRTGQLISNLSLARGLSISRVVVSEQAWREGDSTFLANARDEAVPA